ncbi:FG-GAP repeat domain-containing protein, partial [Spirosoma daeguense]
MKNHLYVMLIGLYCSKAHFSRLSLPILLLVSAHLFSVSLYASPLLPNKTIINSSAFIPSSFVQGTNPFTMTMAFASRMIYGDFDNDGDIDILYQSNNTAGAGFGYVRNNGAGSYTDVPNANTAGTPFTNFSFANQQLSNASVLVFDYDNDGDVDIIDRETTGGLGVWRNDNGTFVQGTDPFTMTMAFASRMIYGDFDNDGDIDILYQSNNT